jgi:predicted acylesterase/phospholipase RssA/CRP-like cAMP-binding protein
MNNPSPQELSEFLSATALFAALAAPALAELVKQVETTSPRAGDTLVRQGETSDSMYLVFKGQLSVSQEEPGHPERLLRMLGRGELFGEVALLRATPRTATVRATQDSILVRLSRAAFERVVRVHPEAMAVLERAIDTRLAPSVRPPPAELLSFLASTSLFRSLPSTVLEDLEPELTHLVLAAGDYLFRQRDPADSLYLVVNGRLRVLVEKEHGHEEPVGELGRGDCIGELGILTDEPRAASARALRDTALVRVSKEVVNRLLERHPRAMFGFVRTVVTQMRSRPSADHGARAVALVAAGPSVDMGEFAEELTRALGVLGKAVHVTGEDARAIGGENGEPLALMRWQNELEAAHRYVLYECDTTLTAWTKRCLRQADRVLVVGHENDSPEPGAVEVELARSRVGSMSARVDLALLHAPSTRHPKGTLRWLTARNVASHHHLHVGSSDDVERMVRRLSGRGIGLVLSGGAAHGFAHVGVIRALREHGIPVDRIGGTSMGSFIAAEMALGLRESEMVDGLRKVFVEAKPLSDITLPVASFIEGRRFADGVHAFFGDVQIEDLWQGYFCVSGNLTRGEPHVHRSGPLWNAVRTSCTIPGLVPPVVHGTSLHIDGGVSNNLPDDVMREDGQGPVIAVDVGPSVDLSIDPRYSSYPSSWKVLAHNVMPFGEKVAVPTLVHLLARTAMLSSHSSSTRAQAHAALYLRPDVRRFGFLDFKPIERIAEAGYAATKDQIAAWWKTQKSSS